MSTRHPGDPSETTLAMAKVVRVARSILASIDDGRGVPPNERMRLREALNELDEIVVGSLVSIWRERHRESNG